jgi:hypothetical protein
MNLEEFLFTLATVFFTTSFIIWLRVLVYDISKGNSKVDESTAKSIQLFRNQNK